MTCNMFKFPIGEQRKDCKSYTGTAEIEGNMYTVCTDEAMVNLTHGLCQRSCKGYERSKSG